MSIADRKTYLSDIITILLSHWPENRTVNIVCHGHSVPAGYFATPLVDSFNAYPHLLHAGLKQRYPYAVINVIVTAIGGEESPKGSDRFQDEVLCHRPDVITIDYGLNDRRAGLEKTRQAWSRMIEGGLSTGAKIILLTPTLDMTQAPGYQGEDKNLLDEHARQIRELAEHYQVGLADSFAASHEYLCHGDLTDILSWPNHPNRQGHEIVVRELLRWFPVL